VSPYILAAHNLHIPLDITLPSAHHSPSTVNKKASEFVIGTVNESSARPSVSQIYTEGSKRMQLTSLPNEQEKPNTSRDVQEQRHSISRVPEQVHDRVQDTPDLAFHPWRVGFEVWALLFGLLVADHRRFPHEGSLLSVRHGYF
jgi:hypothetical protein